MGDHPGHGFHFATWTGVTGEWRPFGLSARSSKLAHEWLKIGPVFIEDSDGGYGTVPRNDPQHTTFGEQYSIVYLRY